MSGSGEAHQEKDVKIEGSGNERLEFHGVFLQVKILLQEMC